MLRPSTRSLVTAPASEPVTLTEAKLHLRVDSSAEDDLITALIETSRQQAEQFTRRALVSQTWDFSWDAFPPGMEALAVPLPPLLSVSSITYIDTDGAQQTLSTSVYSVGARHGVGILYPKYDQEWPASRAQRSAVTSRVIAGYGDADAVPPSVKTAMKMLIGHLYENREAVTLMPGVSDAISLPLSFERLLWPFRALEL